MSTTPESASSLAGLRATYITALEACWRADAAEGQAWLVYGESGMNWDGRPTWEAARAAYHEASERLVRARSAYHDAFLAEREVR